mgnify:CR=1 FL=1
MLIKYDVEIKDDTVLNRLKQLTNLIYKLLPMREEGGDWQTLLFTIIEELGGISRLIDIDSDEIFFSLLAKLEGLFDLTEEDDFFNFRRIIFECLNLMSKVKKNVSIG